MKFLSKDPETSKRQIVDILYRRLRRNIDLKRRCIESGGLVFENSYFMYPSNDGAGLMTGLRNEIRFLEDLLDLVERS